MTRLKKFVTGSLLTLTLVSTGLPVTTHAGCFSDGVQASYTSVQHDSSGYYAYGYVKMSASHTTTSQLKHDGKVIKSKKSAQDTGKVSAKTGSSKKYESGWKSSVYYETFN